MKKILVLLCVVAFLFGTMSCKKECECTTSVNGITSQPVSKGKMSKKECQDAEKKDNNAVGGIATIKCVQK